MPHVWETNGNKKALELKNFKILCFPSRQNTSFESDHENEGLHLKLIQTNINVNCNLKTE